MTTDLIGATVEHDSGRGRVRAVTHHTNESNRLVLWVQDKSGYLAAIDSHQVKIVEVVQ